MRRETEGLPMYMYLVRYIVTSISIVARGDDAYRERIFYSVLLPSINGEIGYGLIIMFQRGERKW